MTLPSLRQQQELTSFFQSVSCFVWRAYDLTIVGRQEKKMLTKRFIHFIMRNWHHLSNVIFFTLFSRVVRYGHGKECACKCSYVSYTDMINIFSQRRLGLMQSILLLLDGLKYSTQKPIVTLFSYFGYFNY